MLGPFFWKKYFEVYDTLNHSSVYEDLIKEVVDAAEIKPGMYVFDAGAGTGNVSMAAKAKGARVLSFDFSPEALQQYKKKDSSAETMVGDLTQPLPFPDETFDVIVSNNVLYNLPRKHRPETAKELYRILKTGGKIVLSNVHRNYRPIIIYKETIKLSLERRGLLKTCAFLLNFFIPTVRIFLYNFKIQHQHKLKSNNLFLPNEQATLLKEAGFHSVSLDKAVFAGQGILNTAQK